MTREARASVGASPSSAFVAVNEIASRTVSNQTPTKCTMCFADFANQTKYVNHLEDCIPRLCGVCGIGFCDYETTKIHLWNSHERLIHQCKYCLQVFYDDQSGSAHKSQNCPLPELFECEYCVDHFETLSDVERHSRQHLTDVWFECDYCSFQTPMKVKLNSHLDRHREEKIDDRCRFCTWGANNIFRLLRHIKEYHIGKLKCESDELRLVHTRHIFMPQPQPIIFYLYVAF